MLTQAVPGADPDSTNHDLAPTAPEGRTWGVFSVFAMWMSDVHSVGGYTFAASLFFLGLTGWQVLISMVVGITGRLLPDEPDRPAVAALRHPVPGRWRACPSASWAPTSPRIVRGVVGIVWYGVQTYFASKAVQVLMLTFVPAPRPDAQRLRRPVHARVVQLPVHVVLPARIFLSGMETHPQVHRFLRTGRLRRHVRCSRSGCCGRPASPACRSSSAPPAQRDRATRR